MSGLVRIGYAAGGALLRLAARVPLGCGAWLLDRAAACDGRAKPAISATREGGR